jgi:uncharacterized repeat protein (TIGR03803 family)
MHTFGGTEGSSPQAALIVGTDGNLYGTTAHGGTGSNNGAIFKMDLQGNVTPVYSFTGGADGGAPQAALVQGLGANFYTTASDKGNGGDGTVFLAFIGDGITAQANLVGGAPLAGVTMTLQDGGQSAGPA